MGITYPRPGNPSVSVSGGGTDDRSPKAAYGTAAEWAAANPVLALGEFGYETDTYVYKIGDGSTAWSSLTTAGGGTYVPAFTVSAPTGVAATDWANINTAVAAASAVIGLSGKPTRVVLQSGQYNLGSHTITAVAGLTLEGAPLMQTQSVTTTATYIADGPWTYGGGTLLYGDGTAPAISANTSDAGSSGSNVGTTQISGFYVKNLAFDTFTYGIWVGAKNVMGLVWGGLDNLYFKNCSVWGIKLVNFVHLDIGRIETTLCQNGQYYGVAMDALDYQGGNSTFRELYHLVPNDGRDNRLCRNIVFEVQPGTTGAAAMNELDAQRIQSNCYNRTLLSDTVTFTSSSTSATVADGTKYAVGMPVTFTTTADGYTANQVYVVLSVSSNTLTFGNNRNASAISATGSGNLTLNTYGYPCVEVVGVNSTTAKVQGSRFPHLDLEGKATTALYVENGLTSDFGITSVPTTLTTGLVVRNTGSSRFTSRPSIQTDIDANSTGSEFFGQRSATVALQRALKGMWIDSNSTQVLAIGPGQNNQGSGGDIQIRVNGFMYPATGMGERIVTRDTSISLAGTNAGTVVFNGATGQTLTLPTIVTDTTPNASHIGLVFDFVNVSGNSVTVATDGTQLFNTVGAKTSLTVATQTGLRVVAAKTNSGTLFWTARAYSLA